MASLAFRSADDAVARYLLLGHRLGTPRAASLTVSLGRSYAARCPRCAHVDRFTGREGVERCARCGAPWPSEDVEVSRASVQMPARHGGREIALIELGLVGKMIAQVSTWPRRALLVHVGEGVPFTRLGDAVRERWPRAPVHGPWWWGQRVQEGRDDLTARLRRRGWL